MRPRRTLSARRQGPALLRVLSGSMVTPAEVAGLVRGELGGIEDARVAAALQGFLVPPRACRLAWDYGAVGASYPGFVVAAFPESRTGIAYSEHGFGPSFPWVLIWLERPGFGMDSNAFSRLEEAFRSSMAWDEPPPRGYALQGPRDPER